MYRNIWVPGVGTVLLAAVGIIALIGGAIWLIAWLLSHLQWVS